LARKLTRDSDNAILGGVAAGLGRHLDVDPVLVRLAFVMVALLHGLGILFYIVCWIAIPRDTPSASRSAATPATPADRAAESVGAAGERAVDQLRGATARSGGGRLLFGWLLIVVGSVLLIDEIPGIYWPHWAHFSTLWPLILVVLGVAMISRSVRPEAS
jgi:phage shock protein PspC (stress-responsive transcriptional regulator)